MEEIFLSPLLEVIFDRIASPVLRSLGDIWDLEDNLKKLQEALLMVQAIIEDAEEQQVTRKAVRTWLSRFRDAAYDTEDILNDFAARASLGIAGIPGRISISINANNVRKMLQAFEMTAIEGLSLNLSEGLSLNLRQDCTSERKHDKRETSSFIVETEVHGRNGDKEAIVRFLLSCEGTKVIPLIGIGGIGKTTLAQLAYNDDRATQYFDVKIWVFVSEIFDVKRIMKTIIESATKERCKFTEMDLLQSKVWDLLHKKRYLIVLDDVWTEDPDDWDKLRPFFSGGAFGSKIIITTRSKRLAMMIDFSTLPYILWGLADDDCWALFKQRAFQRGEEENYPNLVHIGRQIVRKCRGLPLAAKTLGSLMRIKREEREWLLVAGSDLWSSNLAHSGILPSLMLSYHHLPSPLKRCFAFCSIFPKNYEIKKEKLIHLWMAEGLIPQEGEVPPEDIGNEYFNDLLWMCFFQEAEKRDGGSLIGYKMHDIIHDLARYVAGKEFLIVENCPKSNDLIRARHSSVVSKFGSFTIPEDLYKAEHLRTLILIVGGDLQEVPRDLFLRFKYLLVLDLNSCGLTKLHESVGNLFCLKYLDLSYTFIRDLPQTIGYLYSLETLNLHGCCNLEQLPALPSSNLKHLITTECEALKLMPERLPQGLQTLPVYIVKGRGFSSLCSLEHLNLHGSLKIKHLQNIMRAVDAQIGSLRIKKNLKSLGLYWYENDGPHPEQCCREDYDAVEDILEALEPHQKLENLLIEGYPGTKFLDWMLLNLITITLTNCKNCKCLPALGNLASLKTISLCGIDSIKCINMEFYGDGMYRPFPALEELILRRFPNLEEWSTANDREAFPNLRKLIISNCPKLTKIPLFQSTLQHLELRDSNQAIFSTGNVCSLLTLAIEKIPESFSLSGSFLVANTLLTSLEIISCPKLHSLPTDLGRLTALKSLTIRWCEELTSLPQSLQNLRALESLEISECHSMISLPENALGGLSSLRTLSIENCNKFMSLSSSLEHLTSLERLTFMYCPSLHSLPEGLQHLSSLQSLTILSCPLFTNLPEELKYVSTLHCLEIHSCPGVTALPEWLKLLTSLRSLTISECPNLKCLPECPRLLSGLQRLCIQDCPDLEERSKRESGEDWPKIAHIPYKHIGSPRFRKRKSIAESSSSATSFG